MKLFGLIGHPVSHSFSKKYFTEKFEKEKIEDCVYELFDLPQIEGLDALIKSHPNLRGLNVTIPHKQAVFPYLDEIHPVAKSIGAVNVIKIEEDGRKIGYNSDYFGFKDSLLNQIGEQRPNALILGTGGASKAVKAVLIDLDINFTFVSRNPQEVEAKTINSCISYQELNQEIIEDHLLIINTTPLGTYPKEDTFPNIPYQYCTSDHFFNDLVYNPPLTTFMKKGKEFDINVKNGLEMLERQAEKSWEIWNNL